MLCKKYLTANFAEWVNFAYFAKSFLALTSCTQMYLGHTSLLSKGPFALMLGGSQIIPHLSTLPLGKIHKYNSQEEKNTNWMKFQILIQFSLVPNYSVMILKQTLRLSGFSRIDFGYRNYFLRIHFFIYFIQCIDEYIALTQIVGWLTDENM